jgi:mannosyltransferase OCH1-like enzyme
VEIPNRKLFDSITHLAQKSDFLRYHILNQFGGVYVDTDFECLKPFDDFLYLDFFTGIGYPKDVELYIGLLGSIPHHPILEHLIKNMTVVEYNGKWRKMFHTTGSYFFTRMFLEMVNKDTKGVVAFPMDFFYSYPNNFVRKDPTVNPYSYIRPCSYAIHHWAVSWRAKK